MFQKENFNFGCSWCYISIKELHFRWHPIRKLLHTTLRKAEEEWRRKWRERLLALALHWETGVNACWHLKTAEKVFLGRGGERGVNAIFATGVELNQSSALTETKAGIVLRFLFFPHPGRREAGKQRCQRKKVRKRHLRHAESKQGRRRSQWERFNVIQRGQTVKGGSVEAVGKRWANCRGWVAGVLIRWLTAGVAQARGPVENDWLSS